MFINNLINVYENISNLKNWFNYSRQKYIPVYLVYHVKKYAMKAILLYQVSRVNLISNETSTFTWQ